MENNNEKPENPDVETGKEAVEIDTLENKEDEVDEAPNPTFGQVMHLSRPEWPMMFLALIMMIASEVAFIVPPLILADAYDAIVNPFVAKKDMRAEVRDAMVLVFILHWAGMFLAFIRGCILGITGERVVARLRVRLYSTILQQEIGFFDKRKTGELVSRLGSDTTIVQTVVSASLPEATIGFVKIMAHVVLMFILTWKLTLIVVLVAVVILFVCIPFGTWVGKISKQYQDALGAAQTSSTEALGGMRTVRSFVAEKVEEVRYSKNIGNPGAFKWWWPWKKDDSSSTYRFGSVKTVGEQLFGCTLFGFAISAMYVSLWFGFDLVIIKEISFGRLMAFQSYVFTMAMAMGMLGSQVTEVLKVMGASKRIFELLNRVPMILPNPQGCIALPKNLRGDVSFEDVWFSYPTRPGVDVLQDFSLKVPANSTAALVGSSGCGKSTVVALLQRFYDVSKGCIRIDGEDIRNFDPNDLRSFMGFVQQEPILFGLTIRENVCYGVRRKVTDEELQLVCQQANAYDFISEFPETYDTLVGERGVRLSGGQKQRICIARALLVDPRVLLLDEATSALDAESEHVVQQAIEKLMEGRTTLIVAHRLSTVRDADQIVVMDENRIEDIGSHKELMERCVKYQELIKRQTVFGFRRQQSGHSMGDTIRSEISAN